MVLIEFTAFGSCTLTGNFQPGDRLRCKEDMARHFVEVAKCAKFVVVNKPQDPPHQIPPTAEEVKPRARRGR